MRLLAAVVFLLAAFGCKTTDPLSDDEPRREIEDQGSAARCIEDPNRDDAPAIVDRPITDTFGIGPGINVKCHDRAAFRFNAPAHPSHVTLKVTVANLSADEVTVLLNGRQVGVLAGDGDRTIDLPIESLRPGSNSLLFDNVKNPPADESWSVSQLELEFD